MTVQYTRVLSALGLISVAALATGCENAEKAARCADLCVKVEECGTLTPPAANIPGVTDGGGTGNAAADCGVNCVQPDSAFYGYADCQLDCLESESCGSMQDCWDATTDVFANYCGGDAPEVGAEAGSEPDNGTNTGSAGADAAVDNPAVEEAVDGSDFVVNTGSNPPALEGLFNVYGEIYESSNARPVGSAIGTELCFHNLVNGGSDITVDYCEYGVPGIVSAPITGEGSEFTMYFVYEGQATILFSGSVSDDGSSVTAAEALVVYTYTVDSWEKSSTDWTLEAACDGSECTQ
jgi:hypothetical protein